MKTLYLLTILIISFISFSFTSDKLSFSEGLEHWLKYGDAEWTYSDNELIGTVSDGEGHIISKNTFDNFILELEFYPDSTINSGVFIRCADYQLSPKDCHEINIWDLHPKQEWRTGAIVFKSNPIENIQTINKWNKYKIKAEDYHIQVWIDDVIVSDLTDSTLTTGYIGLQAWGKGQIKFRNIILTKL